MDGPYLVGLATRPHVAHYWPCDSLLMARRFAADLRAHGWGGRVWIEHTSASASRRDDLSAAKGTATNDARKTPRQS